MSELLQAVDGCSACGRVQGLYCRTGGERLCWRCWRAAGSPRADDLGPAHELEIRTRERMTARGSTDRHMVRNGRT